MRKTRPEPYYVQVAENRDNLVVDKCNTNARFISEMQKRKTEKIPATVTFRLTAEEQAIIAAGKDKHGLRKTSDILRMALRRFKEAEGLQVAS